MQKTQKQCRTLEESCFKSDFAGYYDKTMQQIRKQHKTLKIIAVGIILQIQKSSFFSFFTLVLKNTGISRI